MVNKYSNEKDFDKDLKEIGTLYEEGKAAIICAEHGIAYSDRKEACDEAFKCLQKLRDIAAMQLKKSHIITKN